MLINLFLNASDFYRHINVFVLLQEESNSLVGAKEMPESAEDVQARKKKAECDVVKAAASALASAAVKAKVVEILWCKI